MSPLLCRALALALALGAGAAPAVADDAEPVMYTCAPAAPSTKLTVSFKPDTSVADLAVWVAGFTCESVVIGPDVAKHATRLQLVTPAPMTPKQAVKLFVTSLEAAGLRVKHKDRTFTVTLGPGMPRACPDLAATAGGPDEPVVETVPTIDADRLADKVADRIRRIDATHVEVPRATFDEVMANPLAVSRGARVVPSVVAGTVNGFRIYAVRPGSIYARLGVLNGDTITTINGHAVDTADRALDAYTALRGAAKVELGGLRRGKPFTLTITITP